MDKSKVFISYSRADERVTSALARDLQQAGIHVWMDKEDIAVGERWSKAIQRALEDTYAMILVLSPESMDSPNVEDEFTYFLDNNKPIIPVMVRECRLHFQLQRLQWIDFSQGNRDEAYHQLLRALHGVGVEFDPTEEAMRDPGVVSRLMDEIDSQKRLARRRRQVMAIIAALLAVTVLIAIGLVAFGQGEEVLPTARPTLEFITARVESPDAVLYELPSRDSTILLENIPLNSLLIVRQHTPDDRFLLVEFGRTRGFVLSRDVEENDYSQIALYLSPTPEPTATATQFITPTPTVTPSPTPEVVMNPEDEGCIVLVSADASPQAVYFGPSSVLFAALDTVKSGESFVATAQTDNVWLYIGIGWIDSSSSSIAANDPAICNNLPDERNLLPNRIRPFIKDLPVAQVTAPRRPITTEGIEDEAAANVAEVWNEYGGLLENLSELLNIEEGLLAAVIVDEATSDGGSDLEDPANLMDIRFEVDVFEGLLPKEQADDFDSNFFVSPEDAGFHQFRLQKEDDFMDFHGNSLLEWQAFAIAREINPEAAIRALRFGQQGPLGNDHAVIGYITPQQMFDAYMNDPSARVIGKLDYIKGNSLMLAALRFKNWEGFGNIYNEIFGAAFAAQAQINYEIFTSLR